MKTPMTDRLTMRLDRETMATLAAVSSELGLSVATLARMWLKDRVRQARRDNTDD